MQYDKNRQDDQLGDDRDRQADGNAAKQALPKPTLGWTEDVPRVEERDLLEGVEGTGWQQSPGRCLVLGDRAWCPRRGAGLFDTGLMPELGRRLGRHGSRIVRRRHGASSSAFLTRPNRVAVTWPASGGPGVAVGLALAVSLVVAVGLVVAVTVVVAMGLARCSGHVGSGQRDAWKRRYGKCKDYEHDQKAGADRHLSLVGVGAVGYHGDAPGNRVKRPKSRIDQKLPRGPVDSDGSAQSL
jgi:hypothetical protein